MASIQIHEIETPIEDLSYDVAGNITGGELTVFDCARDFFDDFVDVVIGRGRWDLFPRILVDFFDCLENVV